MKKNSVVTLRQLVREHLNMELPKAYSTHEREMFLKALKLIIDFEKIEGSYKFIYFGKKER